jgi:hypothetical protein
MSSLPVVVRSVSLSGEARFALGDPLVDQQHFPGVGPHDSLKPRWPILSVTVRTDSGRAWA